MSHDNAKDDKIVADANWSYCMTPELKENVYGLVPDLLQEFANKTPENPAFLFLNSKGNLVASLTCREVYETSKQFACGLLAHGLQPGDVVAMGLPNIPEWIYCHFGTIMAGGVPMGFLFSDKDGSDLEAIFNQTETKMVIFDPGVNDAQLKILLKLGPKFKPEGGMDSLDKVPTVNHIFSLTRPENMNCKTVRDVLESQKEHGRDFPRLDPDDSCVIILTSGSSDIPKPVLWSHYKVLFVTKTFGSLFPVDGRAYYSDRSFAWMGGYPFHFLGTSNTQVTITDLYSLKSVREVSDVFTRAVEDHGVDQAVLIMPCISDLLSREKDFQQNKHFPIKVICTGGVPLLAPATKIIGPFAHKMVNIYGATEFGLLAGNKILDPGAFKEQSVGFPAPGGEIKVVDTEGALVAKGTEGEILVRFRSRFGGYVGDLDCTSRQSLPNGWFRICDTGRMLENGELIVLGRMGNVINIGGKKLHASYIEARLKECDGVLACTVIPVANTEFYQVPFAFVIKLPTSPLTEESLRSFYMDRKCESKDTLFTVSSGCPKYFMLVSEFPRTPIGKVDYKILRQWAMDEVKRKNVIFISKT